MITLAQLRAVMPECPAETAGFWVGPLNQAMWTCGITTPKRIAPFLAQLAEESSELRVLEENLHYRADRLREIWPHLFDVTKAAAYAGQPEKIANYVYANHFGNGSPESGDGWRYRGQGPIQLTFKDNFRAYSIELCGDADTLLLNPELVKDPDYGSLVAAHYWQRHGLNELADAGNFTAITRAINPALAGLKERTAFLYRADAALA